MKCGDINDLIMKYFDGAANDIELAHLKGHFKSCKKCCDEFESLREIFEDLKVDGAIEVPENFEDQLMVRIAASGFVHKKADRFMSLVYAVASITLIALTAILFTNFIWPNYASLLGGLGSYSKTLVIIFNALKVLYLAITDLKEVLLKVTSALIDAYYYVLLILAGLFFTVQKIISGSVKYESGEIE